METYVKMPAEDGPQGNMPPAADAKHAIQTQMLQAKSKEMVQKLQADPKYNTIHSDMQQITTCTNFNSKTCKFKPTESEVKWLAGWLTLALLCCVALGRCAGAVLLWMAVALLHCVAP